MIPCIFNTSSLTSAWLRLDKVEVTRPSNCVAAADIQLRHQKCGEAAAQPVSLEDRMNN